MTAVIVAYLMRCPRGGFKKTWFNGFSSKIRTRDFPLYHNEVNNNVFPLTDNIQENGPSDNSFLILVVM
jgi:hypothetical protein